MSNTYEYTCLGSISIGDYNVEFRYDEDAKARYEAGKTFTVVMWDVSTGEDLEVDHYRMFNDAAENYLARCKQAEDLYAMQAGIYS